MATQIVKTNRRTYDNNPQGSSTATVTTNADNPFERSVSLKTNSMLPSMGMAGLGAADAATDAAPKSDPWAGFKQTLAEGVAAIGMQRLGQEILKSPQPSPLTGAGASRLPAANNTPLSAPGMRNMPPANSVYPIRQSMTPQPGGIMGKLPWIIGGVAVLGIGSIFLFKKK